MNTFLGKFLYLGIHLYKIVDGNIGHNTIVDIDFNLQYKCKTSGFYRNNDFIKEMIDGILSFRRFLTYELGFKNVYAIFTAPTGL